MAPRGLAPSGSGAHTGAEKDRERGDGGERSEAYDAPPTRTVAFYSYVPKLHSLYREIIDHPPDGYAYAVDDAKLNQSMRAFYNNPTVKDIAFNYVARAVDTVRVRDHLYKRKAFAPHDLLYSTGYLCLRPEPWVVDMEFPSTFTGYDMRRFERRKGAIARTLASPYCRRIIPWTRAASEVMLRCFPQDEIARKVLTVPLAIRAKPRAAPRTPDGTVRLLFVGSSNLVKDFAIKGGPEAMEAFRRLRERRDDVEMTVRCYVPPDVKARYARVPGLRIVEDLIPREELERLYREADIFVGVAHHTPGVAHLEAMSYGLPVIATDVWENARIVGSDAGLIVPPHAGAQYYGAYGMPVWGTARFMREIEEPDERRVRAIMDAIATLADDAGLRARMSAAALRKVEEGEYSIRARNALLKRVYDEAIGDRAP